MTFLEQRVSDLVATIFNVDEFADLAVYDNGVEPVQIPVRIDYGQDKTSRSAVTAVVRVLKSDVPSPVYRQTITISGQVWTVDKPKNGQGFDEDGLTWYLPVIHSQKVTTPWK